MVIFVPVVNLFCFPCIVVSTSPIVGRIKEPFTSMFPITLKGKLNGVITSNVTRFVYDPVLGRIP
jgi:hypothetical protein